MAFLFGGARPSASTTIQAYIREINRHARSMDREAQKSLRDEKVVIKEIFANAGKNDIAMAKLKAKELVRLRTYRKRVTVTQQGLLGLSQQLKILHSTQQGQEVLAKATRILHALDKKMDIASTYRMLQEFERQSTNLSEKQELVNETLDSVFETDMADVDSAMGDVFSELGLKLSEDMSRLNVSSSGLAAQETGDDLEARLARLRHSA